MTSLSPWLPGVCTGSRGNRLTDTAPHFRPHKGQPLSRPRHILSSGTEMEKVTLFHPSFLLCFYLSFRSFIPRSFLFFSRFCFYCWGSSFSLLFPLFFPILNFVVVVLFVFVFFVSLWLVCRCVVVVVVSLLPVVLYCFHVVDTNTSNENFGRFTWLMPQTRCRSVSAIF